MCCCHLGCIFFFCCCIDFAVRKSLLISKLEVFSNCVLRIRSKICSLLSNYSIRVSLGWRADGSRITFRKKKMLKLMYLNCTSYSGYLLNNCAAVIPIRWHLAWRKVWHVSWTQRIFINDSFLLRNIHLSTITIMCQVFMAQIREQVLQKDACKITPLVVSD